MAFYEEQFPPLISIHAQGGPGFRTDVVIVDSGQEQRNVNWEQARRRYDVAHAARLPTAANKVKAFFLNMQGRAHGFRYKDWTDYAVAAGEGYFTLLTATTFQMVKRYVTASRQYDRVISKPVNGTVTVTGGASAVVDYATGIVSVSSGTPTSWVGEFDVPARFDVDELIGTVEDKTPGGELIISWQQIPIVEIRV